MPERGLTYQTVRRVAGLGSLGHVRVVAIAQCHGAKIAREAKALVPSSVYWAKERRGRPRSCTTRSSAVPCVVPIPLCVARALDRSPLVATLYAHRTERPPQQPRRTPTAVCHGMGDGQHSPGYRGRAKIRPSPSEPPQTKLAVRSRQRHGKDGHQRLADLEKVRRLLTGFSRLASTCSNRTAAIRGSPAPWAGKAERCGNTNPVREVHLSNQRPISLEETRAHRIR